MSKHLSNIRTQATELIEDGISVCRIKKGCKSPTDKKWNLKSAKPNDFHKEDQIGIICGPISDNIIGVDLDFTDDKYKQYIRVADQILPHTKMVDGREGKERTHRFYKISDPDRKWSEEELPQLGSSIRDAMEQVLIPKFFGKKHFKERDDDGKSIKGGCGIDLIGASGQVVTAGSLHSSGSIREWNEGARGEPLEIDFKTLMDSVKRLAFALGMESNKKQSITNEVKVYRDDVPNEEKIRRARSYAEKMEESIEGAEGNHYLMKSCIKILLGFDLNIQDSLEILNEHWNYRYVPEWSDDEMIRALQSCNNNPSYERGFNLGTPTIRISPDEKKINDSIIKHLSTHASKTLDLFERSGKLVSVIKAIHEDNIKRPEGAYVIKDISTDSLRERFTEIVKFEKYDRRSAKWLPAHPPVWSVNAIHKRGYWPGMPQLAMLADHPIMLPNGDILTKEGYHEKSGIYLLQSVEGLEVPSKPNKADAYEAALRILDMFVDFPIQNEAHKSVLLSEILTPLARPCIDGPTPMHINNANIRGAGKTKLIDAISKIISGNNMPKAVFNPNKEEMRKVITASLKAGDTRMCFDNATVLGGEIIDKALTDTVWQDRILGSTEEVKLPMNMTWYATGNNVSIYGDTARRSLQVKLSSPLENPEDRQDFKYPNILKHIEHNRKAILSDAFTILKAHFLAGRPKTDGRLAAGSFEEWSEVVQGAIMYAGIEDPVKTRIEINDECDTEKSLLDLVFESFEELVEHAKKVYNESENFSHELNEAHKNSVSNVLQDCWTSIQILDLAARDKKDGFGGRQFQALHEMLAEISGDSERPPNSRKLGNRLRAFKDRVYHGKKLSSC